MMTGGSVIAVGTHCFHAGAGVASILDAWSTASRSGQRAASFTTGAEGASSDVGGRYPTSPGWRTVMSASHVAVSE